jgi:hypothetical protein
MLRCSPSNKIRGRKGYRMPDAVCLKLASALESRTSSGRPCFEVCSALGRLGERRLAGAIQQTKWTQRKSSLLQCSPHAESNFRVWIGEAGAFSYFLEHTFIAERSCHTGKPVFD